MLVLAIESSTSSAKALLYDTERGVVNSVQKPYGSAICQDGKTDTEKVCERTMQIARQIAADMDVQAIGLCGTWHGMTVCDQEMNPLTPTFSWDFKGTVPFCEQIRKNLELTDRLYRNTGCMPYNTYPRHAVQYLRAKGMELRGKRFVTQGAYNFFQLTGMFAETPCTQSGSGLLNLHDLDYDAFTLDFFGIEKDQLGELVTYKDVRPLSQKGASLLGLRPGIPVVPAHADGALNQVGNYANRRGLMTMSVGTSGAIRVTADRPILPEGKQLWCYYGVDKWISGAAISGACNCINWFMKTLLSDKAQYWEMETVANEDANVPVFLPFLFGERCPGWDDNRLGGFRYIDSRHTLKEMYKGLQMGILFNLYQCYQILCREVGRPEQMIVSGGIINSAMWTQMVADIFEREILVAPCSNASLMGAVALALHAAGGQDDIDDFKADFSSVSRVRFRKEKVDYYRSHFERYMEAYREERSARLRKDSATEVET